MRYNYIPCTPRMGGAGYLPITTPPRGIYDTYLACTPLNGVRGI